MSKSENKPENKNELPDVFEVVVPKAEKPRPDPVEELVPTDGRKRYNVLGSYIVSCSQCPKIGRAHV